MGKALYRAYRSRSFDEVVGQDHIVKTLKNSLANQAVSHAYLLTGPKGVGKTSIARILAFAVNDLKYLEDVPHLDIIEIDAASNRRIDEVREIRERVRIAPTSAKYKVYIIDEVHMLTREAFNALLKTLEEPPRHAIFILATTEAHKVPETIVSRCIRLTFKPIDPKLLLSHLAMIAKAEKIDITSGALQIIAHHAQGSFRDGISLLEQIAANNDKIDVKDAEELLGIAPAAVIDSILTALKLGMPKELESSLAEAYRAGTSETTLAYQIIEECRNLMISPGANSLPSSELLGLQKSLLNVAGSPKPRTALELALFEVLLNYSEDIPNIRPKTAETKKVVGNHSQQQNVVTAEEANQRAAPSKETKPKETKKPEPNSRDNALEHDIWPNVLDALKARNATLYGIARMGEVEQENGVLKIGFKFPFHFKQVNDPKNRTVFAEVLSGISGGEARLEVFQIDGDFHEKVKPQVASDENLKSVTNIFGDAEVLES